MKPRIKRRAGGSSLAKYSTVSKFELKRNVIANSS